MESGGGEEGGEKRWRWRVDGKGFVLAFTMGPREVTRHTEGAGPREVTRHTVGAGPRGSIGILLGGAFTAPCSEGAADNFCIISVL